MSFCSVWSFPASKKLGRVVLRTRMTVAKTNLFCPARFARARYFKARCSSRWLTGFLTGAILESRKAARSKAVASLPPSPRWGEWWWASFFGGIGHLHEEGCRKDLKPWPCSRQKWFIPLPCLRQETLIYDHNSFHFPNKNWQKNYYGFWSKKRVLNH